MKRKTPKSALMGIAANIADLESGHFIPKMQLSTLIFSKTEEDAESDEDENTSGEEMPTENSKPAEEKTTYFRDGMRKIDYILAYATYDYERDNVGTKKMHKARRRFLRACKILGLQLEEEEVLYGGGTLHFIKIHAPWDLLANTAEAVSLKVPIRYHVPVKDVCLLGKIFKILKLPNIFTPDMPYYAPSFYCVRFRYADLESYLGSGNRATFFTNTQRIRIVHTLLSAIIYGDRKEGHVGLNQLLEDGVFLAAYPLHDGDFMPTWEGGKLKLPLNRRQVLYAQWASYRVWYKEQPLHHIREYFGEKIAMYFAWFELYNTWLGPLALVGVVVFIYGILSVGSESVIQQVCSSKNKYKMCPACSSCDYWSYSEICTMLKVSQFFDNEFSIFFAIFSSFWAVTFLEYWKRQASKLAYQWDCWDLQIEEEPLRADFAAKAPFQTKNPVTGKMEPMFPKSTEIKRKTLALLVLPVMVAFVALYIFAIVLYKIFFVLFLYYYTNMTYDTAHMITIVTGVLINFICIMFMSCVFETVALKLTKWEIHRTDTEFENQLIVKTFVLEFVNFYASIFYVAYFEGAFVGYPGHYTKLFGVRNESCYFGGCLLELHLQLGVLFIGKILFTNAQETIMPRAMIWWRKRKKNKKSEADEEYSNQWERDFLLQSDTTLQQDYLQIVWQYGFITLFVVAMPLVPLVALFANHIELRVDADNYISNTRRPAPQEAKDIGIWFHILDIEAHLSVITSAFLIAFTTSTLSENLFLVDHSTLNGYIDYTLSHAPNGTSKEDCLYEGFRDNEGNVTLAFWKDLAVKFAFVVIYEHVVFVICKAISFIVPDVATSVAIKMKRQLYLSRRLQQRQKLRRYSTASSRTQGSNA